MKNSSFVVVDIETTGLSPKRNKLIEIFALKINKDGCKKFSTLIDPKVNIPSFITRLTGITNKMVQGAPEVDDAIVDLAAFIDKDDIFVAHNTGFDYSFLNHNFMECLGRPLSNEKLCTLRLARRVYPGLSSYKLSNLCERLGIESDVFHRAEADVNVTKELLDMMKIKLFDAGVSKINDVLKFQKMPIAKASKIINEIKN